MAEYSWLSLEEDEELLWDGNPKLQRIIGFRFTDYVVTSRAVYRKSGIFSRNVQKIGYDKIQNISFSQGILGKVFGYGNVEISTAGGSGVEMRFRSVDDPRNVQETINSRIKTEKEGSGRTEKEILESILEEVREIKEKL